RGPSRAPASRCRPCSSRSPAPRARVPGRRGRRLRDSRPAGCRVRRRLQSMRSRIVTGAGARRPDIAVAGSALEKKRELSPAPLELQFAPGLESSIHTCRKARASGFTSWDARVRVQGEFMPSRDTVQTFNRSALAVAVSAACGTGVPAAHAQQQLDEIIVTATKREAALEDVPLAVTAFTEDQIVRQGFRKIDDYVGQIPGLTFSRREPGGTTVLMRGCTISGLSFGGSSTTSIDLDEQPITMAGRDPDVRLVDVARVEALSGPQGTLFGDASQCGALRIITNKPDTSAFSGWVEAGLSQVVDGDTGYNASAMLNIPLAEDRVALRLVGFLEEEAGYVDNVLGLSPGGTFDNADLVEEDINSATNTGGRAALRFNATDDLTQI